MSENEQRRMYHVHEEIRGWIETRSIPADRHEGGGENESLTLYVGDEVVARFNDGTYLAFRFDERQPSPTTTFDDL